MTKKEIIQLLKNVINNGTLTFKDPADKKYALDMLNDGDLEYFFRQIKYCEVERDVWNALEDMEAEYDALGD